MTSWMGRILADRSATGARLDALARDLHNDRTAPMSLRTLAAAHLERYEAADVRARSRPGGTVHRLLGFYGRDRRPLPQCASTSLEAEQATGIRAAHKRTSELVAAGLLRVVENAEGDPWVRNGGRVLTITDAGRRELARLDDDLRRRRAGTLEE